LILQLSSSAKSGPARWMNLVEALAHIQLIEKCNSLSAQVQLKRNIGNGVIPVKWADSHGPSLSYSPKLPK
jgi:hypothetical protein